MDPNRTPSVGSVPSNPCRQTARAWSLRAYASACPRRTKRSSATTASKLWFRSPQDTTDRCTSAHLSGTGTKLRRACLAVPRSAYGFAYHHRSSCCKRPSAPTKSQHNPLRTAQCCTSPSPTAPGTNSRDAAHAAAPCAHESASRRHTSWSSRQRGSRAKRSNAQGSGPGGTA